MRWVGLPAPPEMSTMRMFRPMSNPSKGGDQLSSDKPERNSVWASDRRIGS